MTRLYVCVCACMLTGWCVQRVVDVIGHPGCEAPVVATVLQQDSSLCVRWKMNGTGQVRGRACLTLKMLRNGIVP